ncbi:spermidine/putrescine ABC transporter substrate-binding protein [Halobacteriales archaeon SW_7_71_33]|nr:MAG: spermidine/putrescine ABC transporter substrate-binding protein [Halobacteriales archaeon SW_7_71_33]
MSHDQRHDDGTTSVSRRSYIAAVGASATAFAAAGCAGGGGTDTINVITWNDFAQDSVVNSVEDNLDVDVEITASTSSTEMFTRLNEGDDFDIAVPNNNLVPRFLSADLIEPVNMDAVGNYGNIYQKFRDFVDQQFTRDGDPYGVPVRWGWYGYAYNTDTVPDHEPSYNIAFEDGYVDADLDGQVIMYDEAAKTMPVAALYLAEERDDPSYREALTENDRMTFTEEQIREMRDLLIDQKSRLGGYISSDTTFISEFQQGSFQVGHSGRNEIVRLQQDQGADNVEFVVPQEGAMAWYETAVVASASDNVETAWEVVNEYISPGTGAALANQGKSPSCNPNVADELSAEEQELYGRIDTDRFEQFVPFKDIDPDVADTYNTAWEEVKSA